MEVAALAAAGAVSPDEMDAALVRHNVAVIPELRSPAGEMDELAARLYRDAAGAPSATLH